MSLPTHTTPGARPYSTPPGVASQDKNTPNGSFLLLSIDTKLSVCEFLKNYLGDTAIFVPITMKSPLGGGIFLAFAFSMPPAMARILLLTHCVVIHNGVYCRIASLAGRLQ